MSTKTENDDPAPTRFPLPDLLKEVEDEIGMRKRVYAKRVIEKKMKPEQARLKLDRMRAVKNLIGAHMVLSSKGVLVNPEKKK